MGNQSIRRGAHGERGQSLVEYALIIVLVAVVAVTGLTVFGNGVVNLYQRVVTSF